MSNDDRSLLPDRALPLARVGSSSRLITRGVDRLRQTERRFIALPTAKGLCSQARAINNCGQVIGSVGWLGDLVCSDSKAVLWEQGRMVYLETRPGWLSSAYDINDLGQIVGVEYRGEDWEIGGHDSLEEPRAVLWDNYRKIELKRIGNGCAGAYAINNRGQIVGWADVPAEIRPSNWTYRSKWRGGVEIGETRAALWQDGHRVDLKPLFEGEDTDADDVAYGINNRGVIVGSCNNVATLWNDGHVTELNFDLTDLPNGSEARAINDRGLVVGTYIGYDVIRDILWQNGFLTDLGSSLWEARRGGLKINNRGQAVGIHSSSTDQNRACLWEDGRTIELGTPTSGASYALGLNDLGHVVGSYEAPDGILRACLWE